MRHKIPADVSPSTSEPWKSVPLKTLRRWARVKSSSCCPTVGGILNEPRIFSEVECCKRIHPRCRYGSARERKRHVQYSRYFATAGMIQTACRARCEQRKWLARQHQVTRVSITSGTGGLSTLARRRSSSTVWRTSVNRCSHGWTSHPCHPKIRRDNRLKYATKAEFSGKSFIDDSLSQRLH